MTEGVIAEPLDTKVARHLPVIEVVQPNPRFGTNNTTSFVIVAKSVEWGGEQKSSGYLVIQLPRTSRSETDSIQNLLEASRRHDGTKKSKKTLDRFGDAISKSETSFAYMPS